jgi:hypothetical protein
MEGAESVSDCMDGTTTPMWPETPGRTPKERKCSFLKKRTKKLLFLALAALSGHGLKRGSGGEIKVFWFFSSEKNILAFIAAVSAGR